MRVSEVYASVQGEGPRTGQTTVFVRFGGCNLRCPGWPCDTQHAIDPVFRKEWLVHTPEALATRTRQVAEMSGAHLITLTGGEPFLQNHDELEEFVNLMHSFDYEVEAFTNGTLAYPDWAVEEVTMIVDWKLPGSGEFHTGEQVRFENLDKLNKSSLAYHSVKFVCKDRYDYETAKAIYRTNDVWHDSLFWYYGRVWDGDITNAELVEWVMRDQLPWKLNVQLHNYIWDPQERGR